MQDSNDAPCDTSALFFQCYMACMMGLSHSVITTHILLCNNYASQKVIRGVIRKIPDNIHLSAIPCCPLQTSDYDLISTSQAYALCSKYLLLSSVRNYILHLQSNMVPFRSERITIRPLHIQDLKA